MNRRRALDVQPADRSSGPLAKQRAFNQSVSFQSDIDHIIRTFGKLKLYEAGIDNWLRNIETYASLKYNNDCEWLRTILRHIIDDMFIKWLYTTEREKRKDGSGEEFTWCELRKKLKTEYDRVEIAYLKMIGQSKSDFLASIRPFKEDKTEFDRLVKSEPIVTYFKQKIEVIRLVLPQMRDEAALISVALSTSQDSSVISALSDYRNSSLKEFYSICSVEDEDQKGIQADS